MALMTRIHISAIAITEIQGQIFRRKGPVRIKESGDLASCMGIRAPNIALKKEAPAKDRSIDLELLHGHRFCEAFSVF